MQLNELWQKSIENHTETLVQKWLQIFKISELSDRDLRRSVLPHLQVLIDSYHGGHQEKKSPLKDWGNAKKLPLAYILNFFPTHAARMAAIWSELDRWGFHWQGSRSLRCLDLGSGPGTATLATKMAIEAGLPLPAGAHWTLVDRDREFLKHFINFSKSMYSRGSVDTICANLEPPNIDFLENRYNLLLASFMINELGESPTNIADWLFKIFNRYLERESLIILLEPGTVAASRNLLEIRAGLVEHFSKHPDLGFLVVFPCLGHQACGALTKEGDWCHETLRWKKPALLERLDLLTGHRHEELDFSYLVILRSQKKRTDWFKKLPDSAGTYRFVSDPQKIKSSKKWIEGFLCGPQGKVRATLEAPKSNFARGDLLTGCKLTGAPEACKVTFNKAADN